MPTSLFSKCSNTNICLLILVGHTGAVYHSVWKNFCARRGDRICIGIYLWDHCSWQQLLHPSDKASFSVLY